MRWHRSKDDTIAFAYKLLLYVRWLQIIERYYSSHHYGQDLDTDTE